MTTATREEELREEFRMADFALRVRELVPAVFDLDAPAFAMSSFPLLHAIFVFTSFGSIRMRLVAQVSTESSSDRVSTVDRSSSVAVDPLAVQTCVSQVRNPTIHNSCYAP
jgi:hypothetical protein